MAKQSTTEFVCDKCNYTSNKFFGICPKCKEGFGEEKDIVNTISVVKGSEVDTTKYTKNVKDLLSIEDINVDDAQRFDTGFPQLNMVFGGSGNNKGLMPDSVNVLFGRPGIGKSTLLMQLLSNFSKNNLSCAYVSAEENPVQLKERYKRLGLSEKFYLTDETNTFKIKEMTKNNDIIIIDSINTMYMPDAGVIGGTSQLNANIMFLMEYAKKSHKTLLIISQVNKNDEIAGTNFFKHMVDGVFEFLDMEEDGIYRIVQSSKNRFGQSNETTIMKMDEKGLTEVEDPSFIFIQDNESAFGNATSMILQGNRPIFIDLESLVTESNSDKKIYNVVGFDSKKYMQILAIITKYLDIFVYNYNVFTNIAGGVKIKNEPQIDLASIASILSSINEFNINKYIFIGEVSLNGSIRKHKLEELFIKHCKKMGIQKEIICYSEGYTHIKDLKKIF